MKNLIKLLDLSGEEIIEILNLADQLKYELKHNIPHRKLEGKSLGMIFREVSTRTRVSFETGIYQLGGIALYLSADALQLERGEPVCDTSRTLSRYLDGVMMRTYSHEEIEAFAEYSSVPVINGLTDLSHPCQVLADLMTVREFKQQFNGLKMCYIGDGNNMANSLIVGGLKVGMDVSAACPKGYEPHKDVLEFAGKYDNFILTDDPLKAAENADVLFTDSWYPMVMSDKAEERRKIFADYRIDDKILSAAAEGVMIQHCLPARKGEEITAEIFEAHADEIFEEAENRLHAQKAVMLKLMS